MPWSPLAALSWALVLRLLALLWPPGLGEACSCAPAHPQQHVCHSALGESMAFEGMPVGKLVLGRAVDLESEGRGGAKILYGCLLLQLINQKWLLLYRPWKYKA